MTWLILDANTREIVSVPALGVTQEIRRERFNNLSSSPIPFRIRALDIKLFYCLAPLINRPPLPINSAAEMILDCCIIPYNENGIRGSCLITGMSELALTRGSIARIRAILEPLLYNRGNDDNLCLAS